MLIQRTKKLTRKEAYKLGEKSIHFLNLLNLYGLYEWFRSCFKNETDQYRAYGDFVIKQLSKPLIHMPDYESNPGLWVYEDTDTGTTWMIYSDCHKKNAYMGTSFELIFPENITVSDIKKTIANFFTHFNTGFKE